MWCERSFNQDTFEKATTSDASGMEKVWFGRVRVYPNFQMSGSGISGIEKVGFWRVILGSGIPGPITNSKLAPKKTYQDKRENDLSIQFVKL